MSDTNFLLAGIILMLALIWIYLRWIYIRLEYPGDAKLASEIREAEAYTKGFKDGCGIKRKEPK